MAAIFEIYAIANILAMFTIRHFFAAFCFLNCNADGSEYERYEKMQHVEKLLGKNGGKENLIFGKEA